MIVCFLYREEFLYIDFCVFFLGCVDLWFFEFLVCLEVLVFSVG